MAFFDKKFSLNALKDAAAQATDKVSSAVQSIDISSPLNSAKGLAGSVTEHTARLTLSAYTSTVEGSTKAYQSVHESVTSFDYEELLRMDYYQERFATYRDLSTDKVTAYFKETFEVDKSTFDMVNDVRAGLPVQPETVDDIFEQCKQEAWRRAIAVFALGGIMAEVDDHSDAKYANLSVSYTDANKGEIGYAIGQHKNYASLGKERNEAIKGGYLPLENGYDKSSPLFPTDADVEHVISRQEIYKDPLLRIATTDSEIVDIINNNDNLVFANSSVNKSKKEKDLMDFLDGQDESKQVDPNKIVVTIKSTGEEHIVDRDDAQVAYDRAKAAQNKARLEAVKEVGMTVATTGATMAAQQVVGLIVVETIDVFVDEIQRFATKGRVINADGWLQNTKDATERLHQRLAERFEERKIWERAKSLGLEAGVAGALSVIPQILISLILKMPAFVLAMVRECTLSTVRCVRVLISDDTDKFDSIQVILAGTAAAIVGVYVGRVISTAVSGVPLLNQFNASISNVLTGVMVTGVPLAAIYTFERNKNKLSFITAKFSDASN